MILEFTGWGRFGAKKQPKVIKRWLTAVRAESQRRFAAGMLGRHSGVKYPHLPNRSSAPRTEYPANQSGRLLASLKSRQTRDSATIGTNVYYAKFLRTGTGHMARRKMTDNALREGALDARPKSRGWVAWQKVGT